MTAPSEKVLDTLGQAASKPRGALRESLATVQKLDVPLEQVTATSLQALQAYSLGEKVQKKERFRRGPPYHQRAIQVAPKIAHPLGGVAERKLVKLEGSSEPSFYCVRDAFS